MTRQRPTTLVHRAAALAAAAGVLVSAVVFAATVNVTPANYPGSVTGSRPGDTLSFQAKTTFRVPPGVTRWPTDRAYVGNGATLAGDGNDAVHFDGGSSTPFSDFTLDGTALEVQDAGGFNFHDNESTRVSGHDAVFVAGNHDSHFDHNTFHDSNAFGIQGYPGDHNTYSDNRIDRLVEGIHLTPGSGNDQHVDRNVITNCPRNPIEIQLHCDGLTVNDNWVDIGSVTTMNLSIACGADGSPPFAKGGHNIEVARNVCLGHWCAVEIMGDENIVVHDNYLQGSILNGTGGQRGGGLVTRNNVIITNNPYADGDSTPWRTPPRVSTGDRLFNYGNPAAPKAPAMPTTAGRRAGGGAGPATPPPPTPPSAYVSGLKVQDVKGLIVALAYAPAPAKGTLERRDKNGSPTGWQRIGDVIPGQAATNWVADQQKGDWEYVVRLTVGTAVSETPVYVPKAAPADSPTVTADKAAVAAAQAADDLAAASLGAAASRKAATAAALKAAQDKLAADVAAGR